MVAANLVGFVAGTDGVQFFFSQLLGTMEGLRFMGICLFVLFVGAQFMFEYRFVLSYCLTLTCSLMSLNREEELRQGIVRNC